MSYNDCLSFPHHKTLGIPSSLERTEIPFVVAPSNGIHLLRTLLSASSKQELFYPRLQFRVYQTSQNKVS